MSARFQITLHIGGDFRCGELARGDGQDGVFITAEELPEFLSLLAASPTPATLQDWFTRKARRAA